MVLILAIVSCKKESKYADYDLIQHGLSLKIKAPAEPEVNVTDLGIAKDIAIKKGEHFHIQIISSAVSTYSVEDLVKEKREEVEAGPFFSEIIEENPNGFVFEKKIDENNINYDFRYIRIQGDTEYSFQTGLLGKFSKEDAIDMFEAVQ